MDTPTLRTIEEELAWRYWDTFRAAFLTGDEQLARIVEAAKEGATEVDLDHTFAVEELAWAEANEELREYLQMTGEPFEAYGYHFRIDLNGEVECTLAEEREPKQPPKTDPYVSAAKYLDRHPERRGGDYLFHVP